MKQLTREK